MSLIDENGDIIDGGYSDSHRNIRISTKSILPDMKSLQITDLVKHTAENIYHSMGSPVCKDRRRKIMVFCCIIFAYAELDVVYSPRELLRMIGLPDTKISTYVKEFSMNRVGYHPPQRFHTVAKHANFLLNKMNVIKVLRDLVMNMAHKYQEPLKDCQPDLAAAVLIARVYEIYNPIDSPRFVEELKTYILLHNKKSYSNMMDLCLKIEKSHSGDRY